jgi:ribonucleoside-diphosphate reductase alpha chain
MSRSDIDTMAATRSEKDVQHTIIVIKRDGSREDFDISKLARSIALAIRGSGLDMGFVEEVVDKIYEELEDRCSQHQKCEISSRDLADLVEKRFMIMGVRDQRFFEAAKRYALARIYQDVYDNKWDGSFNPRDLLLTYQAIKVLESRYLLKNPETLRYIETPQMLFRRVARVIASVEKLYGKSEEEVRGLEERFYELMSSLRFVPNTPTLMNAGTKLGILSACFVIPVRDSLVTPDGEGIMDALRAQAIIQKMGGGTGFHFSELRPEGDVVGSTAGVASGPLSFMRLFDVNTDVIKQGGKRRGANMGILHIWHPDIEKFIVSKTGELRDTHLQNFNISVGMYDAFMKALENAGSFPLINPRKTQLRPGSGDSRYYAIVRARYSIEEEWVQEAILEELEERGGSIPLDESRIVTWEEALTIAEKEGGIVRWIDAKELWKKIVKGAWDSGDPGIVFIDTINRRHPAWYIGKINATNPCVTGDTRILSRKGYIKIGDLVKAGVEEEDLVIPSEVKIVYMTKTSPQQRSRALSIASLVIARSRIFSQGIKPVYKIVTREGYELKATPDHRLIAVVKDECPECEEAPTDIANLILRHFGESGKRYKVVWKRVDAIKPGDMILLGRMSIDELGDHFGDISIGEDMAFLIGWLVGDGYIRFKGGSKYVAFYFNADDEENIAQLVIDILRSRSPDASIGVYYQKNTIKVMTMSKSVLSYFVNLVPEIVNKSSEEREVPEVVYRLKPREIAMFLRGLFTAYGSIDKDSAIRLSSTSLKLLKQVQELLLLFGIVSKIYRNRKEALKVYDQKEYHELVIARYSRRIFMEKIGFASVSRNVKVSLKKTKVDLPLARVEKIEYIGEEEVFDASVPAYHYYITGGFISHNCAEEPLLDWEPCNLGSLDLAKYIVERDGEAFLDLEGLARDIRVAVRFLDNVIDAAKWPLPQLERGAKLTRKIGLGVMGWAHTLIRLGIRYDSVDAIYLAWHLARFIYYQALKASIELSMEKGAFPAFIPRLYRPAWEFSMSVEEILKIAGISERPSERVTRLVMKMNLDPRSLEEDLLRYGVRNAQILSIAPTGTISIIAGTSSSIEPIFALAFVRSVAVGTFIELDRVFLEYLRKYELDTPEVVEAVAETGSIAHNPFMPRTLRELFRTAHDVSPLYHVLHQASWQQWVDAGTSKTINMVSEASEEDVESVYLLAWRLGIKGITVYRDKSKSRQVIYFGLKSAERSRREEPKEGEKGQQIQLHQQDQRSQTLTQTSHRGMRMPRFTVEGYVDPSCKTCEL